MIHDNDDAVQQSLVNLVLTLCPYDCDPTVTLATHALDSENPYKRLT